MQPFNRYFSDEAIIRELCRIRIAAAKSRNDRLYLRRLIGPVTDEQLPWFYGLLPPRESWSTFRSRFRGKGPDANLTSLYFATLSLRVAQPNAPWAVRLAEFLERVRGRVFSNGQLEFRAPNITWQPKKDDEFRALCRFSLEDNLINSLTARYLRDFFDPVFTESSYAFRSRPTNRPTPTYHTAFNKIYDLKAESPAEDLYVAECDIRGFFDSVDHGVAVQCFNQLVHRVQILMPDRVIDPAAVNIFLAFLNCYSFPENVLRGAAPRLRAENPNAFFPWPEEALRKFHSDPFQERIGIPQGGAISPIIANLVLDLADRRVEAVKQRLGGELYYLRYCDDMILLARNKSDCQRAFDAYLTTLDELKLPYHKPEKVYFYEKEFWDFKSKQPYRWTGKKWFGCVPWVQFVGYQLRYDGLVRIKKKSVEKQREKLKTTTDELKFSLLRHSRPFQNSILANKTQAVESLRYKLIAQGVGRLKRHSERVGPMPMCWASGYKALHGKPFIPTFLRKLDRERQRHIRRFERTPIVYGPGRVSRHAGRRESAPAGFASSYSAQYQNAGGWELVRQPFKCSRLKWWAVQRLRRIMQRVCDRWPRLWDWVC